MILLIKGKDISYSGVIYLKKIYALYMLVLLIGIVVGLFIYSVEAEALDSNSVDKTCVIRDVKDVDIEVASVDSNNVVRITVSAKLPNPAYNIYLDKYGVSNGTLNVYLMSCYRTDVVVVQVITEITKNYDIYIGNNNVSNIKIYLNGKLIRAETVATVFKGVLVAEAVISIQETNTTYRELGSIAAPSSIPQATNTIESRTTISPKSSVIQQKELTEEKYVISPSRYEETTRYRLYYSTVAALIIAVGVSLLVWGLFRLK